LFSSRRRHTRSKRDWSSDVCSSDLLLQDVVLTLGQQAEWKNINLTFENDLDEIWFEADLPRVKQVVINLIHNAINYTQEGGDVRSEERRVGKESSAEETRNT